MATLDAVNSMMSPCTSLWADSIDKLSENEKISFATTRMIGPLAAFPLLVDSALHVGASVLKALYAVTTGTLEIAINAFTIRFQPVNPLNTYRWNKEESARHLVKAVECIVMAVVATPLGLLSPSSATSSVRYLYLAHPAKPKPVVKDDKPATVLDSIKSAAKTALGYGLYPIDVVHNTIARYPLFANIVSSGAVLGAVVGGAMFATYAFGQNYFGLNPDCKLAPETIRAEDVKTATAGFADATNPVVDALKGICEGENPQPEGCSNLEALTQNVTNFGKGLTDLIPAVTKDVSPA